MSHDAYEPRLRIGASGYGGSGYALPTRPDAKGKPTKVPGVTTVLNILDKPGIVQWSVNNTAAYAVANVDALLNRTEEQGYGFLRWYHKRQPDFDNPETDLYNYHTGVLHDLAELGTMTHDAVADFVTTGFMGDLTRDEQAQMVSAFLDWWDEHDVQVVLTEVTVVGNGYSGTLDHLWVVDGVPTLIDLKTSRATRDEHFAQLAALGACDSMMVEVDADHPGAVEYETKKWGKTYWVEEPVPAFSKYAILHLRPDEEGREAFCELKEIPQEIIDKSFPLFTSARDAAEARYQLKKAKKEVGWE